MDSNTMIWFSLVTNNKEESCRTLSHLKIVIWPMYKNPAIYGARIVNKILRNCERIGGATLKIWSIALFRFAQSSATIRGEMAAVMIADSTLHIILECSVIQV